MYRGVVAVLFLFSLCLTGMGGCDGIFPAQMKEGPPEDHTENQKGAFHKSGLNHPFRENSGCSANECHHSDLRGGLAEVDGRITVSPSCYQCHGERWDDDLGEAENDDISATLSLAHLLSTHEN